MYSCICNLHLHYPFTVSCTRLSSYPLSVALSSYHSPLSPPPLIFPLHHPYSTISPSPPFSTLHNLHLHHPTTPLLALNRSTLYSYHLQRQPFIKFTSVALPGMYGPGIRNDEVVVHGKEGKEDGEWRRMEKLYRIYRKVWKGERY